MTFNIAFTYTFTVELLPVDDLDEDAILMIISSIQTTLKTEISKLIKDQIILDEKMNLLNSEFQAHHSLFTKLHSSLKQGYQQATALQNMQNDCLNTKIELDQALVNLASLQEKIPLHLGLGNQKIHRKYPLLSNLISSIKAD